jgi:hypothetical protein
MANFILPYEPEYTAHRTDEQKHIETKKWLSHRIDDLEHSPSIGPERPQFSKAQGTEQPPSALRRENATEPITPIISYLAWSGF